MNTCLCPTIHATNYSFLSSLIPATLFPQFLDDNNNNMPLQFVVIDCGIPLDLKHGTYQLLNSSTTYQSIVKYHCHDNYSLIGNETRNCSQHATWTGTEPTCKREFKSSSSGSIFSSSLHAVFLPVKRFLLREVLSLSQHALSPLGVIPIGICLSWEEEVRFPSLMSGEELAVAPVNLLPEWESKKTTIRQLGKKARDKEWWVRSRKVRKWKKEQFSGGERNGKKR